LQLIVKVSHKVCKKLIELHSNWYYGDRPSNGLKELQFTGGIQENVNSYTITEDALNTLTQQNKTLKFTIQIQWTPRKLSYWVHNGDSPKKSKL
jgi:hypothetical protein